MLRKSLVILLILSFTVFQSMANHSFAEKALKVFISVDMEGITGIVNSDQLSSSGKDYGITRKWMTKEVNAAIQGALDAGATEIVVNDSHGSMRNVIADDLMPEAYLITGSPKPLAMMQGIDETFDAVIFIGYHARAGTEDGVLDHTISSRSISSIKVNGIEMGEAELNSLIAGWYEVPVVLITGDAKACSQATEILGTELETAVVKEGVGRYAAKSLTPEKAQKLIEEKTKTALGKRDKIKPFTIKPPYRFELNYLYSYMADQAELIPQVERTGGRSIRFETNNYIEGFKLFMALVELGSSR